MVQKKTPTKKAAPKKEAPAAKKAAEPKKVVPKKTPPKKTVTKSEAPAPKVAASSEKAGTAAPKIKGIRIRLSAFDHTILDETALKIIDTALRTGALVHGPIPLPTKFKRFTVNRSTFVHKDARDQFEMRIHRRLIDLSETTFKTVDSLQNLSLPSGVDIEIRMG
ncbi:MAG: 30S ribosomal protein S10 [Candidatus Peribacteraceae bacterium]